MKVSELQGAELDYWVAKAEGHAELEIVRSGKREFCEVVLPGEDGQDYWTEYRPSADWGMAGPIIEREKIYLDPQFDNKTDEFTHYKAGCYCRKGTKDHFAGEWAWHTDFNPVTAAMRAYVASKFGDVIPTLAGKTASSAE